MAVSSELVSVQSCATCGKLATDRCPNKTQVVQARATICGEHEGWRNGRTQGGTGNVVHSNRGEPDHVKSGVADTVLVQEAGRVG